MAKNLLHKVMIKPEKQSTFIDTQALIEKIESGYLADRGPKHTQKKTFAPSTIAYNHGECPRYWYLAFEGGTFEDSVNAYAVANMTSGTHGHERIQKAMNDAGILIDSEFKIISNDPPIFGFGDVMLNWNGEEIIGEIKTMSSEAFEYRKTHMKPKTSHLVQLLIYMKILKKARGVLLYENKNNHELLALPVEVNEHYIKWVDYAFDWMRTVRKAWENKTLPKKNYRSNSKICKNCPLSKTCATAEAGSIKIESLEELSEVMQVV